MPISIYHHVSTGWFSSKDIILTSSKFVDIGAHKLLSELPVYTIEETESEIIPYEEQSVDSGELAKGEKKVIQEGVSGSREITYVITYRGNAEIGRWQKSEVTTKSPITKITAIGTYVAPTYNSTSISCPNGTYTNSGGSSVCSPYSSSSIPSGATAQCSDGTYSYSQSRRGTCSHHGGVARWL